MNTLKLKLLGLARACDNNEHMLNPGTFNLVREALTTASPDETLLYRLTQEKRRVAPMCADCASPCGRTADPDKSIFADKELLTIDLELLERLLRCGLAYYGEDGLEFLLKRAKELYE